MALVNAANPTFGRFAPLVGSSLGPLIAVLNSPNCSAAAITNAITALRNQADPLHINKANKYKNALHFLQRVYPIAPAQWVPLGAHRSAAVHYAQTAMPAIFNPLGPGMYNAVTRLTPVCTAVATPSQTVEDFIYTSPAPVGVVMIHMSAYQNGMYQLIDGKRVIDHMNSVLRAARHNHGNACALVINATSVCADLAVEFNAFGNAVLVNETGNYHMGGAQPAFNNFVALYPTIVVMGFDASICVRGNLFGTTEHTSTALGANSITPLTAQANVVTSRALLVETGSVTGPEYGLLTGT